MGNKILLLERDEKAAEALKTVLVNVAGHEVVHGGAGLGAVRELTSGFFEVLIAVIRQERAVEGCG
jgi:hypothetical protein